MRRRGVAMAYHGVADVDPADDPAQLVCSPAQLEAHVRLLRRLGFRFLTAAQLLESNGGVELPTRIAVLTFDDGWRDAVTTVAPLLDRLGVAATFYVCPGALGATSADLAKPAWVGGEAGRLLDSSEVRALADAGMDVASHTLTHPDLRTLGDRELATELRDSRTAVENLTGRRCETFAYPFGAQDARVRAAVAAAGYRLAWGWLPGPWDPLAAPRLPGPPRHGAPRLALKLAGVRRRNG